MPRNCKQAMRTDDVAAHHDCPKSSQTDHHAAPQLYAYKSSSNTDLEVDLINNLGDNATHQQV
jgi:hypothetical protein